MVQLFAGALRKIAIGVMVTGVMAGHAAAVADESGDITLAYIGQQIIPHDTAYKDTVVGGLSALDYNRATDRFVAICDDRSKHNPARFYELRLAYEADGFNGWQLTDRHYIRRPDGSHFPKPAFFGRTEVDPEALKIAPGGKSYFWTSEGDAKHGVRPLIREMSLDGAHIRDFDVPEKYIPDGRQRRGVRDNLAFEALTVETDQRTLTVATEGPLVQDGPAATVKHGAPVRFLQLDITSGAARHEYVYPLDPVHRESLPFGNFSINGVVDILAVSDGRYLVVERSFSTGAGLSIRLYLAERGAATDVLGRESLKGGGYQPMTKRLLLDLGRLGLAIDNIEGMTFGKRLEDGRRSLVLVSDNNFRSAQATQLLAFAVSGLD